LKPFGHDDSCWYDERPDQPSSQPGFVLRAKFQGGDEINPCPHAPSGATRYRALCRKQGCSRAIRIPHNTVSVELTNQMSGEQSTRNLSWDEQVTTEEGFEVPIGTTGKITIELAQLADQEGAPAYRYRVTDESAGVDYEAVDLRLGVGHRPNNAAAARSLLGFLGATSEAFLVGHDLEADLFTEEVNWWAHQMRDEITIAQIGLADGLENGL
jgi:hypothetical protein